MTFRESEPPSREVPLGLLELVSQPPIEESRSVGFFSFSTLSWKSDRLSFSLLSELDIPWPMLQGWNHVRREIWCIWNSLKHDGGMKCSYNIRETLWVSCYMKNLEMGWRCARSSEMMPSSTRNLARAPIALDTLSLEIEPVSYWLLTNRVMLTMNSCGIWLPESPE